ncbi:hypothetical protein, variant 1 [Aphanomyces astaci]|nr:hypothetical protein, variant 1 [Aphanomyces astaci]ETV70628.1 hypothetical protein, variant 1 [Aphanomyces astaci]|eukprot:XP_009840012.1 hypothetical protein, variant 1 [Aphanomyces astaci]
MIEALLLCADATGRTALHWSVRNKHAAVASYLLQSAALVGVVVELLQMCDDVHHSPLHVACATGQTALAEAMLQLGANANMATRIHEPRPPRCRRRSQSKMSTTLNTSQPNRLREAMETMSLHDVAQHTVELKTLKLLVPRPLSSPQLQSSTATSCDTVEPIASPLAIALVARSYDIADLLLQYGANIIVRDQVWRAYVDDANSRATLVQWSSRWLCPDIFPSSAFATLCGQASFTPSIFPRNDTNDNSDAKHAMTVIESGLCALLDVSIGLNYYSTWDNLAHAAFSAFRLRRLHLAHRLANLCGATLFNDSRSTSWLVVAVENACLASCRWLQAHDYPFSAIDIPAMCLLLSSPCRHRSVNDDIAVQTRTSLFVWLVQCHVSLIQSSYLQTYLDLALANANTAVTRLLVDNMIHTEDKSYYTIRADHAVVASRGDETYILSLRSMGCWTHCDLGLTLAIHFNMSQTILRCIIAHGARPTPQAVVYGKPAIVWAIWHRRLDIVRVLCILEPTLCLATTDGQGRDALYYAMRTNDVSVVAFLWTNRRQSQFNFAAALVAAVESNAMASLKWMAATAPQDFFRSIEALHVHMPHVTSLEHVACARGFLELATWLRSINSNPTTTCLSSSNADGCTPTQVARLFGYPIHFDESKGDNCCHDPVVLNGVLRRLLSTQVSVISTGNKSIDGTAAWRPLYPIASQAFQFTELYAACSNNSVAYVSILASFGVSLVEPCGPLNLPPLDWAAHYGAVDVIQCLLSQGVVDVEGTALRRAATRRQGSAVAALLDAAPPATSLGRLQGDGATPTLLHLVARVQSTVAPRLIQVLIDQYHADVDIVDGQGLTPVVYAMVSGNVPAMLCLLERGARLEAEYEGQSGFYYVLHLLPSDTWRVFFQAYLGVVLHGRALHCTESCGCKSFEGSVGDVACSFCSHRFDQHSHIPLPPWHQDVSDTYRMQRTSSTTSSHISPESSPRSTTSDNDDHDNVHRFQHDRSDFENQDPHLSPLPLSTLEYDYVGRLDQCHISAVAWARFRPEVSMYCLSSMTGHPDAGPSSTTDDDDEDKEDVLQRGFVCSLDDQPEAWSWRVPALNQSDIPVKMDKQLIPPRWSVATTFGLEYHVDCWCTQGGMYCLSAAMSLRRVVTWWLGRRLRSTGSATTTTKTVTTLFHIWKSDGRRRISSPRDHVVPRTRQQLVRLKLFVLHWCHAKLVQAFSRWKKVPTASYTIHLRHHTEVVVVAAPPQASNMGDHSYCNSLNKLNPHKPVPRLKNSTLSTVDCG